MRAERRVEQQPRRLAGARRQHDDARAHVAGRWPVAVSTYETPVARPSASVVTSRAMAPVTSVSRPVASAGGSSTAGVEKFECVAQPRPHWPQ